ncbi:tectonic-3-like [Polyodon spathula]|uniref:tectonic-3-like n=1 Tax=Polyodon spathula TaxID=7913 RepID=UPI001B7F5CF0|nr:tectonic-3-like [Polyodon spathula]
MPHCCSCIGRYWEMLVFTGMVLLALSLDGASATDSTAISYTGSTEPYGPGNMGRTEQPASTVQSASDAGLEDVSKQPESGPEVLMEFGDESPTSSESTPSPDKAVSKATPETSPGTRTFSRAYDMPLCTCDITPGVCDLNCCCDITDCDLTDGPESVFTHCTPGSKRLPDWQCFSDSLLFRSNAPSSAEIQTDGQTRRFCVRTDNSRSNYFWTPPVEPSELVRSPPSFTPRTLSQPSSSKQYKAGDLLLSFFPSSSAVGSFSQPAPSGVNGLCVDANPAGFLLNTTLTCTRLLTPTSCASDPSLRATTYHSFRILRIPSAESANQTDMQIPVHPVSKWEDPVVDGEFCKNVVMEVSSVFVHTSAGEISNVSVELSLSNVSLSESTLRQTHRTQFRAASSPSPPPPSTPLQSGLVWGSPVMGRFNGRAQPISTLSGSVNGLCSGDSRTPILFRENLLTGCQLSSVFQNCSQFRSELYGILRGVATPQDIAMVRNARPGEDSDWTRVIQEDCPAPAQAVESCVSGCLVPVSLSLRFLWAQRGLLTHPQGQILGAKSSMRCTLLQCSASPVTLTTEVSFVDTTVYPASPRGQPQPDWKLPFDFFYPIRAAVSQADRQGAAWSCLCISIVTSLNLLWN